MSEAATNEYLVCAQQYIQLSELKKQKMELLQEQQQIYDNLSSLEKEERVMYERTNGYDNSSQLNQLLLSIQMKREQYNKLMFEIYCKEHLQETIITHDLSTLLLYEKIIPKEIHDMLSNNSPNISVVSQQIPCFINSFVEARPQFILSQLSSSKMTLLFTTERDQLNTDFLAQILLPDNKIAILVQATCGNIFGLFLENQNCILFKVISPIKGDFEKQQNASCGNNRVLVKKNCLDLGIMCLYWTGEIEFNIDHSSICRETRYSHFSIYSLN